VLARALDQVMLERLLRGGRLGDAHLALELVLVARARVRGARAGGSRRPEPASPCMSAAKAPGSPPSAPTTTSTRRRAGTSGNEVE